MLQGGVGFLFRKQECTMDFGIDVSSVPYGILIIPFISNVLPVAFLCNAEVCADEIDEQFLNSIDNIRCGYQKMYPQLKFDGIFNFKRVKKYTVESKRNGSAMFFSAGIDSFDTLLSHREEKPLLITLWGSDISFEDLHGWEAMKQRIAFTEKTFGAKSVVVKSGFRGFLSERKLSSLVKTTGNGWWYGFQHGIGIIGHAAPYAYLFGFENLYIASSNTEQWKVACASDPSIDEKVNFLDCKVIHDGYEFDRVEKTRHVVDFYRNNSIVLPIHVCWQEKGGSNCSRCEKCCRTILGIYACGEDPRKFGFNPNLVSEKVVMDGIKHQKDLESDWIPTFRQIGKCYNEDTIEDWAKWCLKYKTKN